MSRAILPIYLVADWFVYSFRNINPVFRHIDAVYPPPDIPVPFALVLYPLYRYIHSFRQIYFIRNHALRA